MGAKLNSLNQDFEQVHEINVTPFIDVILVLLIVFMIAAPLATVDVPMDLPVSQAAPSEPPSDPITLSVQANMQLTLNGQPVNKEDVGRQLDQLTHGDKQTVIFLQADKHIPYGDLMGVMDMLRATEYLKIALVGLGENG